MRTYTAKFEIRTLDESGIIEGLASATNVYIPGYNEKVMPGAFKKTLGRNGGKLPIFHMHDPREWIGMGIEATEKDAGLMVKGQLNLDIPKAMQVYSLLKQSHEMNVPGGISIGFVSRQDEMVQEGKEQIRHINEVELMEWSTTPPGFQANPKAKVKKVRSVEFVAADIEQMTQCEIRDLIAHLHTATHSHADPGDDSGLDRLYKALQDLNTSLRRN